MPAGERLAPELAGQLQRIPVAAVVEWVAEQLSLAGGGETVLEFVLENGDYKRGYVKTGPLRAAALDERRRLKRELAASAVVSVEALRRGIEIGDART